MEEIVIKNLVKKVDNNSIEVLSSVIKNEIKIYSHIINATLILENVNGANFEVRLQNQSGEIIDYISSAEENKIYVNITSEVGDIVKSENGNVYLWLGGGFKGNFNPESDAELKIEYISERIMRESNAYYDVSAKRAGNGKINLATGGLNFEHSDSIVSGISHVYNSWQSDETAAHIRFAGEEKIIGEYGCGKGWKLNLQQYLVKRKGTAAHDLYTYIDGNGNYHEFAERYYYKANETKNYVKKETVSVSVDGKLTFTDNAGATQEIKTELKTTSGLMLQTDLNGFAGAEKLELRSEERAQLEEEIESLERSKADCEFAIEEYSKSESAAYKWLLKQQERIEDESAELEKLSIDSQYATENLMDTLISKKAELEYYVKKGDNGRYVNYPGMDYEIKIEAADAASEVVQKAQIRGTAATPGEELKLDEKTYGENQTYKINDGPSRMEMQAQKDASDALITAQKELSRRIDLLQQAMSETSNRFESMNWEASKTVHSKRIMLQQMQVKFREAKKAYSLPEEGRQSARNDELYERTIIDLKKAEKFIELRKFELQNIKEQEAAHFLTDNTGAVMAFNEAGTLIAIADAYENIVYIYYENGKLIGIRDTDNNAAKLEYNEDNLLVRIIDADEKVIQFHYSQSGNLSRVTYSDETITEYGYTEYNQLQTAVNPAGYGIKFTYEHQKVIKTEEFTRTFEITDEGWRGRDSEQTRLIAEIKYIGMATTLTDRLSNSSTYILDILGKPITVYEGGYSDPSENTKSLSIDYSAERQAFSIEDNITQNNWVVIGKREGNLAGTKTRESKTEYIVYDINSPDTHSFMSDGATDFVLSAWAKADSAFVMTERRTQYSYSKIDAQNAASDSLKQKRKFELRAELTYDDAKETVFNASFDWLNTDWQYLALPVTINEEDESAERLTGRLPFILGGEKRKLTRLKLIVDYGYNVNEMEYNCLTLRQGSWTYSELDNDGKVTYSEDSLAGTVERYEYNENNQAVKTIVVDRQHQEYVNTSEYNKQNRLVRSTRYNGLCEETVYDEKGRELKKITYNISDPASKIYSESVRDEKGKVTADIDVTGEFNSAEYEFDHNGAVSVMSDANGNKTAYGYHNDNLVSISGTCDGSENANKIKHTLGYTTRVSSGGTDYTYSYDGWGKQKAIAIAGKNYSSAEFIDDYTTKVSLGSGEVFKSKSDSKNDATIKITANENGVEKEYDCKAARTFYDCGDGIEVEQTINYCDEQTGNLIRSIDKSSETEYTIDYKYNKDGKLKSKVQDSVGAHIESLEQDIIYNEKGNVKNSTYTVNDLEIIDYGYIYENTPNARLNTVILPSGVEQKIEYDALGRLSAVSLNNNFTKEIYYAKSGDHATNYISSVWYGIDGKRDENTRYTYDKLGNITSVRENGKDITKYAYDALNRLIREDNKLLSKTEVFEYDNSGNILTKTQYEYSPYIGNLNTVNIVQQLSYSYSQSGWRDQLKAIKKLPASGENELTFEYDKLGNPTRYCNKSMVWNHGRNLIEYDGNSYDYNAGGIRTAKKNGEIDVFYYLDGSTIIAEEHKKSGAITDEIYYRYGSDGIVGFKHNGKEYTYRKNVQGDITHIYNSENKLVVNYVYDAFGNHTDSTYAAEGYEFLAKLNPFRYRGYYYDTETGLYYLNSRYYDPSLDRFINADDISYAEPETINGLNLYAYCMNNPVMMADPTGCVPWYSWLISGLQLAAGIALCFVPGGQGIGASLIIGGTLGLIANAAAPAIGQAIGGASSIANGWGAFSTGLSILGLGIPGLIGGIALMLVGGATMAFGANEVVAAATGTNYIQQWTGMSDTAYGWTYAGLNIASSLGQMAGNAYRLHQTRTTTLRVDGTAKQYRYYDRKGNPLFDFDYAHGGKINYNHFHGWNGPGLTGRTDGHWSYLKLIWWLFSGR